MKGSPHTQLRGEGLLCALEKLINQLVVMCNDNPYMSAANSITYEKGLISTITFILKVKGNKIVTCTQKLHKFMANSTVTATVVPHRIIQENVCLACGNRQQLKTSRVSTIASILPR